MALWRFEPVELGSIGRRVAWMGIASVLLTTIYWGFTTGVGCTHVHFETGACIPGSPPSIVELAAFALGVWFIGSLYIWTLWVVPCSIGGET